MPRNSAIDVLSLYSGPQVTITIGSHEKQYLVYKNLLCAKSQYFSDMFNGNLKEAREQAAILQEGDGVSVRTFESFLRWLYTGELAFDTVIPSEKILAAIELSRAVHMWLVPGLEDPLAEYIKETILENLTGTDCNLYHISSEHIASASCLPAGHSVRRMLAKASVQNFLLLGRFKLADEATRYPEFASDLLREIRPTINAICGNKVYRKDQPVFTDPFSGRKVP